MAQAAIEGQVALVKHDLFRLEVASVCHALTESLKAHDRSFFPLAYLRAPAVVELHVLSQAIVLLLQQLNQGALLVLQRLQLVAQVLVLRRLLAVQLREFVALLPLLVELRFAELEVDALTSAALLGSRGARPWLDL